MFVAEIVLWVCGIYLALGVLVAAPFIWRGVEKVDAGAIGTAWTFRLLILPGCIALWPWVIQLWSNARKGIHT